MKAMETLHDLIEEAKLRTVWWALCIFAVSYFLAHTSKSMWMNVPIAILLVCVSRILLNEVEFRWKVKKTEPLTYLSHLEKKQLSVNDSRLSTLPPLSKWKRKIDSPIVEAAMEDFINKLLQDFVVDLWYSDITPDKEAPELIRGIIMDVLAEISARVKNINLVDLLTRDVVDLVGVHLELFRKNQAAIGVEVMVTLSSEERDERLKHHLMASNELHPALLSPESEYKFLKRIMGAVVAVVLKPREAQSALVRCVARELLTCLVMEPVMRFASPAYINELLEVIFLASANEGCKEAYEGQSDSFNGQKPDQSATPTSKTDHSVSPKSDVGQELALYEPRKITQEETKHLPAADWARGFEAATQRRTEVLQPENLENMWTKGRNYKKKAQKNAEKNAARESKSGTNKDAGNEMLPKKLETSTSIGRTLGQIPPKPYLDGQRRDQYFDGGQSSLLTFDAGIEESLVGNGGSKTTLRKSNSTSDLNKEPVIESAYAEQVSGSIISEFYSANVGRHDTHNINTTSDKVLRIEGHSPKLRCRVIGAYFEKLGSKSFAVYSIAVTDAENKTCFVKRRYRNFERLHRQLKDIPNYTLHLPPKRIFSSNTEDAFVHQRCIQLDKYLQDLLSIANVAEQHEVLDFLSISSKNYSFGKSSSVMRTLAVNVDDAVDDIVRQFKGVSDGLMRKVVGPTFTYEPVSSAVTRSLTWKPDELGRFPWLTCPRKDLSTGWLQCNPGPLFTPENFALPGWLPEWALPNRKEALIVSPWLLTSLPRNLTAIKRFENLQALTRAVRNVRAEYSVEPAKRISASVVANSEVIQYISREKDVLALLSRLDLQSIHFTDSPTVDANQSVHLVAGEGLEAYLPLADMVDISAEVQRLSKRVSKMQNEYNVLMARLSSPNFVEKAPEDVVRGVREKALEAEEKLNLTKTRLSFLQSTILVSEQM